MTDDAKMIRFEFDLYFDFMNAAKLDDIRAIEKQLKENPETKEPHLHFGILFWAWYDALKDGREDTATFILKSSWLLDHMRLEKLEMQAAFAGKTESFKRMTNDLPSRKA